MAAINEAVKEVGIVKGITKLAKHSVVKVDPVMTLGMAGVATDTSSKLLIGVGMAGLVTAVFLTPVLWVKGVVGGSIVCFTAGFVRGLRKSLKSV